MSFPAYSDCQEVGTANLGDIPSHWELKRLKDVASHNDEALADDTPEDSEFLYVDISSVNTLQGIHAKEEVVFKNAPSRARRKVQNGDVIVSTVRTYLKAIARVIEPEENLIVSTGFAVVRPSQKIDPAYAGFLLLSNYFIDEVISRSTGVSYPAINASDLVRIHVPIPPLDEQKTIASFLDGETSKIDGLVSEQRRLIELLKEKRQAVISHAVTKGLNPNVPMKDSGIQWLGDVPQHWQVTPIKNLCYVNDGNHGEEYPKDSDSATKEDGVPFIRAGDFENFKIIEDDLRYISREKNDSMRKGNLQENDILFVNRGATIGKVGVIDKSYVGANLNSQIAYLRVDESNFSHRYLLYFLSSTFIQETVVAAIMGGALPQYPIKNIVNLPLCHPQIAEQRAIAAQLDAVTQKFDSLEAEAERAIELLQERRSALISAAVTGKIDVHHCVTKEAA